MLMTNYNIGTWIELAYFKWRHLWGNNICFRFEGWVELARGGAQRGKSPLRRVNKRQVGPEVGEYLQWLLHVAWGYHSMVASFWDRILQGNAPGEKKRGRSYRASLPESGYRASLPWNLLIKAVKNLDQCQGKGYQVLTLEMQHSCTKTSRVIWKITNTVGDFSKSNLDLS